MSLILALQPPARTVFSCTSSVSCFFLCDVRNRNTYSWWMRHLNDGPEHLLCETESEIKTTYGKISYVNATYFSTAVLNGVCI